MSDEEFKGGTCCPECGFRQPHIHLGWLSLNLPKNSELKNTFTQVLCEKCGVNSIIVRFMPEEPRDKLTELEDAIRTVFGGPAKVYG